MALPRQAVPRLRYPAPRSPSRLEERFLMLWKHVKGPDLEIEIPLPSRAALEG